MLRGVFVVLELVLVGVYAFLALSYKSTKV